MKKVVFFLLSIVLLITSCEKDDFCIDPITPNLVLRFYDINDPTTVKSVSNLSIWPEGVQDTLVLNTTLDSIAIPLDVNNSETVYNFRRGTDIDQIAIQYTVDEIFVTRSCGFKANFLDLNGILETTSWIQAIDIISQSIEDQTSAHIQVFH